ncbi:MAG TPA: hypothetical protein VIS74_01165 [Chthoniobacterales bacterium]
MKIKELLEIYVREGLREPVFASIRRSPLPPPRPRTGHSLPALANAEIQQILNTEDAAH